MAKATPGWPDNGRPSRRRLDAQHTSQRRLELKLTRCPAGTAAAPHLRIPTGLQTWPGDLCGGVAGRLWPLKQASLVASVLTVR